MERKKPKMNPDTLLTELKTRGIALRVAGDRLMVSDPDNGLTPGLRALISRHKPALIERLPLGVMSEPAAEGTTPSGDQSVAGFTILKGKHATRSNDEIAQALIADCPAIAVTFDTGTSAADRLRVWQALIDQPVAQLADELNQARSALDVLIEQQSDDPTWAATWDRACARYHAARVAFENIPIT